MDVKREWNVDIKSTYPVLVKRTSKSEIKPGQMNINTAGSSFGKLDHQEWGTMKNDQGANTQIFLT